MPGYGSVGGGGGSCDTGGGGHHPGMGGMAGGPPPPLQPPAAPGSGGGGGPGSSSSTDQLILRFEDFKIEMDVDDKQRERLEEFINSKQRLGELRGDDDFEKMTELGAGNGGMCSSNGGGCDVKA